MENLKSIPVLAKDPYNRSPDHPQSPGISLELDDKGHFQQQGHSFDAESVHIPGDPFGTMSIADLQDTNEPTQPVFALKSRLPGKFNYESKLANQLNLYNTEMSPKGRETASKSSLTKENLEEENRLDEEKKHNLRMEKVKDKENQDPREAKKSKKQFHNPLGLKVLKDTWKRKWGKKAIKNEAEGVSIQVNRVKTLADIELEANEVSEKDQEKIIQVSRTNHNLKNVTNLGASQGLEVPQEENPLSNGTVKIVLDQSIRPTQTHVNRRPSRMKGETGTDELKISIDYPDKNWSRAQSLEGTLPQHKEGTKTTIDATNRSSIMNFESFAQNIPKQGKSMQVKNLNLPKRLTFTEKVLLYGGLAFLGALVFYFMLPLIILFLAHDYNSDKMRTYFNFTILGIMQGSTEILLIQYMVDRPLLRRIKELQEENMKVIDSRKYKLLNRYNCTLLLAFTIALQICAGVSIPKMGYNVNAISVLVSMVCIVILGAFLWFVITLVQTPPATEDRKKVLNRELTEIGEIRKNFIKDLRSAKKELDKRSRTFAGPEAERGSYHLHLGALNSLDIKLDVRKFQGDLYQYSGELTRFRLNVGRVYGVLLLALLQLLTLLALLRVTNYENNTGLALGLLIVIGVISTIFGYIEEFISSSKQATTILTKIINLTVMGGVYRFFYLIAPSEGAMIGAAFLKFGSKILFYYVPLLMHEKLKKYQNSSGIGSILSKCFEQKDETDLQYSQEEKERSLIKPYKHIFHKFIAVQNADLFFGLGTLTLLAMSMTWAPGLNLGLTLKIQNFNFYIGIVLIEAVVNVMLWIHFSYVAKRKIQRKAKSVKIEGFNEIHNVFKKRKTFVIMFKSLILFLLLFIFMNHL